MSDAGRGAPHGIAYRPEIDGLRAIAVVAVILFHTGTRWVPGGYLGVDLFFVISGYLITGILARELAGGSFSVARFYERRIRRILPALMLVTLLCIPLAWWLMLPDGLENFGQSLVGAALFANNVVLLLTSGYFDISNQFKPLLHTWSLGVEEQYYLVVPALMWLAWRWGKARGLAIGIAAVTALSFAACLLLARYAPRMDFFLIFSRGWELGAGALAVLVEPRLRPLAGQRVAAALAAAGLLLAVAPLLFPIVSDIPNWSTLFPILGLCLILIFGGTNDPAGRLLSSPPFVGIGLISYSAYLFHQPIFAFTRLVNFDPIRPIAMAALIVPVLLCAWASWQFVERPFRDSRRISTRTALMACAAASMTVLAVGLTFHFTSGFYSSWPELGGGRNRNANIAYNLEPDRFMQVALPQQSDKPRLLVLGNSFGRDFINMAIETAGADAYVIAFRPMPGCRGPSPRLIAQARRADFIVMANRFGTDDVPCIAKSLAALRLVTSSKIIIIGRKSFGFNLNPVRNLPQSVRAGWRVLPVHDATEANDAARRLLPASVYVDIIGMIGDPQGRVPVFTPQLKLISQDGEHLTRAGAIYLGQILFRHPALAALLKAAHPHPR